MAFETQQETVERRWSILAKRLGRRYADATLENFVASNDPQRAAVESVRAYLQDLPGSVESGRNVIFYGPKGTGKDHLMTAMMRAAVQCNARVIWRNGVDLFAEFRDAMQDKHAERNLVDRYTEKHILAISDPVSPQRATGQTDYQAEVFFQIVDRRYRDRLPTWVTINASDRASLEKKVPANVVDRLAEGALSVPCKWESYRQR